MNFVPLEKSDRATFREMLRPPDNARMFAAALMFFFSAIVIPLSTYEAVSLLYLAYAAIFYYTLTRSVLSVVIVALPGALLFLISPMISVVPHAFMLPAIYAALVLGCVGGAFFILHNRAKNRIPLLLLLPVLAYATVFLATFNPFRALLTLVPALLCAVLAYCVLTCRAHTPSVLLLAGSAALLALGAWLILLAVTGWPAGNPLTALLDSIRGGVFDAYTQLLGTYAEQGLLLGVSETDIGNISALLGNLLPALFGVACLVTAYTAWRVLLRLLLAWQTLPRIPLRMAVVTVSPAAAILFGISYIAALIANASTATAAGAVFQNLSVLLEPAMLLVGASVLLGNRAERSCLSQILFLSVLITLWINPGIALAIVAFVGVFHILAAQFLPHDKGGN